MFAELFCNILIALSVQLAGFNVGRSRLDPENLVRVFFVCDAEIDICHKLAHNLAGFFARP